MHSENFRSSRSSPRRVWPATLIGAVLLLIGFAGPTTTTEVALISPAVAGPDSGRLALLAEVRNELATPLHTRYQHLTDVKPAIHQYFYDCSGFVDWALRKVRPAEVAPLNRANTAHGPLAEDYEQYLRQVAKGNGNSWWNPAPTVAKLQPGDIIAWLTTPDVQSRDTGHVMIVLAPPVPDRKRAGEWLISVADSTTFTHAKDSRKVADGLGTGTVGLAVDQSGLPTGYFWKGGVRTSPFKATEVALGEPR